jgi:DNA-binding transcriptional ArsR family regulator
MDMNSTARLDATFAALGDATRRAILQRLAQGDASVTELAAPFAMSQPAISKHLRVLERAGLVARGRGGHRRPCKLVGKPLEEATDWLENYRQFWEGTYARLDVLLEEMKSVQRRKK